MNVQRTNFGRKQKALLVLPLLVIPFFTMAFWAMGGGRGEETGNSPTTEGINLQLPKPALREEKGETKLSFYEREEKGQSTISDTAMEPTFYGEKIVGEGIDHPIANRSDIYNPAPPTSFSSKDPAEEKVYQKLSELKKELAVQAAPKAKSGSVPQNKKAAVETEDVDRLEELMGSLNKGNAPDPELEQLNGMMEKILDIQHPDRVKEKLQQTSISNKRQVYAVTCIKEVVSASLLNSGKGAKSPEQHNFFFETKDNESPSPSPANAVAAVIEENGTVSTGSTVKLRFLTEVFVGGILLPKGTYVFGTATLEQDRLKITVPAVRYKENLLPVSLAVYDLDGLEGVHIPGSITRDAVKGVAEQNLQSMGLLSLDPSLKAQVAAAGVQAVKGLLSRKVKQVKVALTSGYQVLLKNKAQSE